MRKKIINIIGAVLTLAIGFLFFNKASNSKTNPKKSSEKTLTSVVVQEVENKSIPVSISSTGALIAKERMVLFSEVQGVFMSNGSGFKAGEFYTKGQVLININNTEFYASVKSQRVAFKSLVTSILADLKFDYPSEFEAWKAYTQAISSDKALPELPLVKDENLKNYLSIKNINTTFYNVKNLETRLAKYIIRAPFSGVLVKANVTPGTLISPGQSLGEFVKTGVYELQLNVNAGLLSFLQIGKIVKLSSPDHSKNYTGKVIRINAQVERASQTVQLFVEVVSPELKEGSYLEANIEAANVANVSAINRNLIVDQNYVFGIDGNVLKKVPIEIVHASNNQLIVKGLENGSKIVAMPVPGGYEGMEVIIRK